MALPREALKSNEINALAESLGVKGRFESIGLSGALPKLCDLPENETAAQAGPLSGGEIELKADGLRPEDYFASPLDAMPLPLVRAAYERDRLARERLGLLRFEGGR